MRRRTSNAERRLSADGGRRLLPWLFFVSGAAALTLQVVWTRNLGLTFGVTSYASCAVIAAYMAGLSLGSYLFGRLVDRVGRPWLVLGLLEIAAALCALAFPQALKLVTAAYTLLWPLAPSPLQIGLVRLVLAIGLLIVPTTLMGGTLPVAVAVCAPEDYRLGRDAGWLYALNTLGGVCGAALSGFVLMEVCGVNGAAQLAAAAKLAIGVAACLVAVLEWRRTPEAEAPVEPDETAPAADSFWGLPTRVKFALAAFGVQGFASMALEILWLRLLVVLMGRHMLMSHNVYVFATILSIFLLGLAAGSLWMARRLGRVRDPLTTLARLQVVIGLYTIAVVLAFKGFRRLLIVGVLVLGMNAGGLILGNIAKAMAVVFVPTFCMGAALPLVTAMCRKMEVGVGRKLAVIGFLDTIGSVGGAPFAAFVVLPWLGVKGGITAFAGCSWRWASACAWRSPPSRAGGGWTGRRRRRSSPSPPSCGRWPWVRR